MTPSSRHSSHTSSSTNSIRGRSSTSRRVASLSVLSLAALALAACGSSSASTTSTTTSAASAAGGNSGGSGGSGAPRQIPGASGTIAAINGTSLEVQNASSGQTTVTYTTSTTFDQTVTASASDVVVGSCISAFGKPTSGSTSGSRALGGPVTATTVSISQPTSGTCSTGFGGFGGGSGPGGSPNGGPPSGGSFPEGGGRPPSGGRFPSGAANFGVASGMVTAVSGSTATVSETNPQSKKTTAVVVTLTSSTTYTQRQSAAASDLAVGKCAQARGSSSTTGAITAQSITISTPGASGCSSGFGGFPGGGAAGSGTPPGA